MAHWLRVLLLLLLVAPPAAVAQDAGGEQVIVIFRDDVDAARRERVLRQAGAVPTRHFAHARASAARLVTPGARQALERHPDVVRVIPDRAIEKHAKPTGGSTTTGAQVVPAGVQRIGAAPGSLPLTGAGVGVAVVDTGLDFSHRDLQPLGGVCFTAFTSCQDDEGHGTHVGGIIAARDNAVDVVGVAPDALLYAVKVLDRKGRGTDSTLMAGLDWIVDQTLQGALTPPVRVVNMSLGRPGTLDDNPALRALVQALYNLGITVVVSAGNDPDREVAQQVPATYPEVLAVASTTALDGSNACRFVSGFVAMDTASWFTTDGRFDPTTGIGVTASAPGEDRENITRSCALTSVGILSTRLGGGTTRMAGTSMAAPHVAGVAALLVEQDATVGPEGVRSKIRTGAARHDVAPLDSPASAYSFDGEREGILSAPGALAAP